MPPKRRRANQWLWTITIALILAPTAIGCFAMRRDIGGDKSDAFETMRVYIDAWLSTAADDIPLMTSSSLKETILDDWPRQSSKYEIVSLRKPDDYNRAGHIPHAINIYWVEILADESMTRLDSGKTLILYCYYGHASMLVYTILSLLGYPCSSLDFGMMDWNLEAMVKSPWDKEGQFQIEATTREAKGGYPFPDAADDAGDATSAIRNAAKRYFAREGSPILRSADLKAVVDNWSTEGSRYQIIDVRSWKDYRAGHIPNATNIPLKKVAQRKSLATLDPGKIVIVYSENGQRGQIACTVLNLLGYQSVNLLFGMMDWNSAYEPPRVFRRVHSVTPANSAGVC